MNPPTRGRTSTEFTASKCPVKSSQSVTTFSIAGATVTWGVGICGVSLWHAVVARANTAAAVHPPGWNLSEAELARESVELMLQDSVTVSSDWWWRGRAADSMLPSGNIPRAPRCYRSVTFLSSRGMTGDENRYSAQAAEDEEENGAEGEGQRTTAGSRSDHLRCRPAFS